MPHDVFISHSKGDKTSADALCHHLEDEGIRCWIAPRDVEPGSDWTDSISEAIEESKVLLVLFSGESADSRHVKSEVRSAFDRGKTLVPVRVSNIQLSGGFDHLLGTSHWVDAFPKPLHQYFDQVTLTLRKLIDGEQAPVQKIAPTHKVFPAPRRIFVWGIVAMTILALTGFGLSVVNKQKVGKKASGQPKQAALKKATESASQAKNSPSLTAFKFAYVLSNWKYKNYSYMTLEGAREDGLAIKNALKQLGYRVLLKENLSQAGIRSMLADLRELEKDGGTFILYYAGQSVSYQGQTFIIPSDLPAVDSGTKILANAVAVAELLDVSREAESFILYSTQQGQIAFDQASDKKISPFANAFIDNLNEQSDVLDFAMSVSQGVKEITKGKQRPELITGYVNTDSTFQTKGMKAKIRRFVFFDGCRHKVFEKRGKVFEKTER